VISLPELFPSVRDEVEASRPDLIEYCRRLVAAPSVNPPGDTRAVSAVVRRYLADLGLDSREEALNPTMPSVISHIDSGRPGPHLVLNVHLDTMPPGEESLWTVPVFDLTSRDGRLYGLGMGNMKGAVAAMSLTAGLLAQHGNHWRGKVTFSAVADEVVFGDNGAAWLLRQHSKLAGDALLCGEGPGMQRLAVAEKGVLWITLEAAAAGAHSSAALPGGTATTRLARAILDIDALAGRHTTLPPELSMLHVKPGDPSMLLTANIGTIQGGTSIGQVATSAAAEIDFRLPPGISIQAVEDAVDERISRIPGTSWRRVKGWEANWTSPDSVLAQCFIEATQLLRGAPAPLTTRLPASDASRWRRLGVPAVCYGPQPGLSAGLDDYAEEQEVIDCAVLYTLTALGVLR